MIKWTTKMLRVTRGRDFEVVIGRYLRQLILSETLQPDKSLNVIIFGDRTSERHFGAKSGYYTHVF